MLETNFFYFIFFFFTHNDGQKQFRVKRNVSESRFSQRTVNLQLLLIFAFLKIVVDIHNIKFTILMIFQCALQWHKSCSQRCTTIATSHFQDILTILSRNLVLVNLTRIFINKLKMDSFKIKMSQTVTIFFVSKK